VVLVGSGVGAGAAAAPPRSLELKTLSSSEGELRSKATCAAAFWIAALTSAGDAPLRYCRHQNAANTAQTSHITVSVLHDLGGTTAESTRLCKHPVPTLQ
jgi:hypothetical protein